MHWLLPVALKEKGYHTLLRGKMKVEISRVLIDDSPILGVASEHEFILYGVDGDYYSGIVYPFVELTLHKNGYRELKEHIMWTIGDAEGARKIGQQLAT